MSTKLDALTRASIISTIIVTSVDFHHFIAIVIDSEKQCKDSDRSSNISDIKLEIRTGSSASNQEDCNGGHDIDSMITRVGPLPNSLTLDSRYSINRFSSSDYPDPVFPPKSVSI